MTESAGMHTPAAGAPRRFEFVGGVLCLDFCNTVGGWRGRVEREYLGSYGDLLNWSSQAGLLGGPVAAALGRRAAGRRAEASAALERAVALREAVYRLTMARIEGNPPAAADLGRLNAELARCLGCWRLVPREGGFGWEWVPDPGALDTPLGPVARSAGELLTSPERMAQVRQCEGETCGWLFLDATKNHSRRWCDMRDCGNRAKVRRHRSKQRP